MHYIILGVVVCILVLRQGAPIVLPVSAGAPQPAFGEYFHAFKAWVGLQQRVYPAATLLVLVLWLCAALAWWVGYPTIAAVVYSAACLGYIGLFVYFEFTQPRWTF